MKHLLESSGAFVNANLVTGFAFIASIKPSGFVVKLPGTGTVTKLDQTYKTPDEAQKESDRINKWLEQFVDYEAVGTEE